MEIAISDMRVILATFRFVCVFDNNIQLPEHGVGSKRKVSEVGKRKGNKGSSGNGGKKGKYDPNVYLPVLEGQEIRFPIGTNSVKMPRIISSSFDEI